MVAASLGRTLLVVAAAALVSAPSPGPVTEELRRSIDRVVAILGDPALRGPAVTVPRRAAIRQIIDEAIDFAEAAKRALGPHWRARTEAERAQFTMLFKDLVEYSYIVRIEPYADEKIVYLGESVENGHATVRTRLEGRQSQDLAIDYRLHRPDGRWLVYDVSIAGVSLVGNYRTQFNTIIQTSSYAGLIGRMKVRINELRAPASVNGKEIDGGGRHRADEVVAWR